MSPSALPEGGPLPDDGSLPAWSTANAARRPLEAYVHIPFCRVRCGYCDFNTYTSDQLRGVTRDSYPDSVVAEIALARRVLGNADALRPLSTVFFGGGTPTLLAVAALAGILDRLREAFGIVPGAEITVEANPDTVDRASLGALREAGVTRVSFGMQSAVPRILGVLDRTHDPRRVPEVVEAAKACGLETSIDLIYGTPGETLDDWRASLEAALRMRSRHLSAYALIVEQGTALERRIRRGEIAEVDPDLQAEMYELADAMLAEAGYEWYELSNWSLGGRFPSRHNLGYWRDDTDWWGFGPGAHSHSDGVRWWNVKHPAAYAQRLAIGATPAAGHEELGPVERGEERVLLGTRLREGIAVSSIPVTAPLPQLVADGLVEAEPLRTRRVVVPTLRGRLLADTIARALT